MKYDETPRPLTPEERSEIKELFVRYIHAEWKKGDSIECVLLDFIPETILRRPFGIINIEGTIHCILSGKE